MSTNQTRDTPFTWDPSSGIPAFSLHPATSRRKKSRTASRDQKRDIQCAARWGASVKQIVADSNGKLTDRQVRYALKTPATPKKSTGRPPILGPDERAILVDFICQSKAARRMTYVELAREFKHLGWGYMAIEAALKKEGFSRRWAMRKPPISEKNRKLRLQFAKDHEHWNFRDWCKFLWSDETWVKYGRHRKTKVLRRPGEEWDKTCVEEKVQRKKGWMFWGSFWGCIRGPAFLWEKDWGTINGKSYREITIPRLVAYLEDIGGLKGGDRELYFMQDNAPGHAAQETKDLLYNFAVVVVNWPPYSPDLNPIETVWKYMKNYLEDTYGDCAFGSYELQRERVIEAWEEVATPGFLIELIKGMPDRMKAVIKAEGRFTKY